jgi:hypothetical protein
MGVAGIPVDAVAVVDQRRQNGGMAIIPLYYPQKCQIARISDFSRPGMPIFHSMFSRYFCDHHEQTTDEF